MNKKEVLSFTGFVRNLFFSNSLNCGKQHSIIKIYTVTKMDKVFITIEV